jgi:hypothetical protein
MGEQTPRRLCVFVNREWAIRMLIVLFSVLQFQRRAFPDLKGGGAALPLFYSVLLLYLFCFALFGPCGRASGHAHAQGPRLQAMLRDAIKRPRPETRLPFHSVLPVTKAHTSNFKFELQLKVLIGGQRPPPQSWAPRSVALPSFSFSFSAFFVPAPLSRQNQTPRCGVH